MSVKSLKVKLTIDADGNITGILPKVNRQLGEINSTSKKVNTATETLSRSFVSLASSVGLVASAYKSVSDMYHVTAEFESLNVQLKVATGSWANANIAMSQLTNLATTLPLSVQELTSAFIRMKNLGLEPTIATLTSFTNTASANGKTLIDFTEAVADAITGQFERLKEFGIKSNVLGNKVSFTFRGIKTQIGNNAKEINAYLKSIGENEFAGSATEQMNTLNGAVSNLGVAYDQLLLSISKTNGMGRSLTGLVNSVATAFNDLTTAINYSNTEVDSSQQKFDLLSNAIKFIVSNARDASDAFDTLQWNIAGVLGAAGAFLSGNFDLIPSIVKDATNKIKIIEGENKRFHDSLNGVVKSGKNLIGLDLAGEYKKQQKSLDELAKSANKPSTSAQLKNKLRSKANIEREKIQSKINALIETESQKRQTILDSLYPENKALQQQLWHIQDAAKAQKELNAAMDNGLDAAIKSQSEMETAWGKRANARYDNSVNAQWIKDNAQFDKEDANDKILSQTLAMSTAVDTYGDAWTRTGNKALDAMGSMLNVMSKVGANDKKYADQMQVMRKAGLTQTEEFIKLEKARAKNSVHGSMAMLDASVAMFKDGSAAQEAAHKVSLVIHAAEIGMELQKQIAAMTSATTINAANTSTALTGATASVASAGTGDPYTAPFRVAAMAAMMTGVLSQIGVAFGGSSHSAHASYAHLTQSDSGVLGGGQSNAMDNLSKRLEDVNAKQYQELRAINQNTKFLNKAMTSASGALYSTGTISGLSTDLSSFKKSSAVGLVDGLSSMVSDIPVLGLVGGAIGGLVSNIVGGIFGGGTSRTSVGYGLNVGGNLGNVGVGGYQKIKKHTDGGWFGKSKTSYYDVNSKVNDQVGKAINSTFNYLGDTLVEFGNNLDQNVTGLVKNLKVTTGKIDLTGKTSAEVQKALTQAINVQSDKWAYQIFSKLINQYQKLNESAFDTLSRLVVDKSVVESTLKTTGQSVVGDAVALSESLISIAGGLNKLTDAAQTYYDAFFTDAEKQTRLTSQLNDALGNVNVALPATRNGYRSLVESLDLSTKSGQKAYVTLLSLSSSADKYYQALEKQQQAMRTDIINQFTDALKQQANAAQNAITSLSSLKSALDSTFNAITKTVVPSASQYMIAQQTLADAITSAQAGSIPTLSSLQDTLSTLSSNNENNYASFANYQRDQLTTANMLHELSGYTSDKISIEQQMLDALNTQIDQLSKVATNADLINQLGNVSQYVGGTIVAISKLNGVTSTQTEVVKSVVDNTASTVDNTAVIAVQNGSSKNDVKVSKDTNKSWLDQAIGTVGDVVSGVSNTVGDVVSGVSNTVGDVVSGVSNTVGDVVSGVSNTVGDVVSGVSNTVGDVLSGVGNFFSGVFGWSDGGYTGAGGIDEVAGLVHKGEVVWSQADISKAGGLAVVEAMRKGYPGYAQGGVVGKDNSIMPLNNPLPINANSNKESIRLLKLIEKKLEQLESITQSNQAIATHTYNTSRILSKFDDIGITVDAPLDVNVLRMPV